MDKPKTIVPKHAGFAQGENPPIKLPPKKERAYVQFKFAMLCLNVHKVVTAHTQTLFAYVLTIEHKAW